MSNFVIVGSIEDRVARMVEERVERDLKRGPLHRILHGVLILIFGCPVERAIRKERRFQEYCMEPREISLDEEEIETLPEFEWVETFEDDEEEFSDSSSENFPALRLEDLEDEGVQEVSPSGHPEGWTCCP